MDVNITDSHNEYNLPNGKYIIEEKQIQKLSAIEDFLDKNRTLDLQNLDEIQNAVDARFKEMKKKPELWKYRAVTQEAKDLAREHWQAGGFKKARIGKKLKLSKSRYVNALEKRLKAEEQRAEEARARLEKEEQEAQAKRDTPEAKRRQKELLECLNQYRSVIENLKKDWEARLQMATKALSRYDNINISLPQSLKTKYIGLSYKFFKEAIEDNFGGSFKRGTAYNRYQELHDRILSVTGDTTDEELNSIRDDIETATSDVSSEMGIDLQRLRSMEQGVYQLVREWAERLKHNCGNSVEIGRDQAKRKLQSLIDFANQPEPSKLHLLEDKTDIGSLDQFIENDDEDGDFD